MSNVLEMMILMLCIALLMISWRVPPLVALVCRPSSRWMKMYMCQEQSTVCPNFSPLYCVYIQKGLMCLSWLRGKTAVGIEKRVIRMHRPVAVSTDRSAFGIIFWLRKHSIWMHGW